MSEPQTNWNVRRGRTVITPRTWTDLRIRSFDLATERRAGAPLVRTQAKWNALFLSVKIKISSTDDQCDQTSTPSG